MTAGGPAAGRTVAPPGRYARPMEQETVQTEATVESVELVEDELLVEEISIDGMCGVY